MAYVRPNVKSKAALKRLLAQGTRVTVFQPGGIFPLDLSTGRVSVEGPHYPEPHKWYGVVEVTPDGAVTRVIS